VRRTERNLLRRVADRQILTVAADRQILTVAVAIEHSQIGFRNFAAGGRYFLCKNRIVAAEERTLAQYGTITLAPTTEERHECFR
jgi:hypothetical protein